MVVNDVEQQAGRDSKNKNRTRELVKCTPKRDEQRRVMRKLEGGNVGQAQRDEINLLDYSTV